MQYGSVCSGIEAATVAWHPLGWKPAWFSEIDPFPSAVLQHHYPSVPNLGDMMSIEDEQLRRITDGVLVGGTPCQSFSVAGLRRGLADPRGNLALGFLRLADIARPRWVVWENVPGVLSSGGGRDFGTFLGALAELGYGFSYRVLDAQYVRVEQYGRAVPQRRRRVFVVGCLGNWQCAASVLLERQGMRGDSPPRRTSGASVAALTARGVGTCGADDNQAQAGHIVGVTLTKCGAGSNDPEMENIIAFDTTQLTSKHNYSNPKPGDACRPLAAGADAPAVAFNHKQSEKARSMGESFELSPTIGNELIPAVCFQPRIGRNGRGYSEDIAPTINGADAGATSDMRPCIASNTIVRRLIPRECERLQGFPDDYTLVPYRGKPASDGPRYKALGNSMAVNVMRWIGLRIQAVDRIARSMENNDE